MWDSPADFLLHVDGRNLQFDQTAAPFTPPGGIDSPSDGGQSGDELRINRTRRW